MSIDDTDVLARLRAGADTVEEHRFDVHEVLTESRRALRRRRTWQAAGACTTAVVVAFSLALAGPVPVPGLGDVTLPGSKEVLELFGLVDAEESGCEVPEPAVRRSPTHESTTGLRPGVTYDLTDARPMSNCFDVQLEDAFASVGRTPDTLTDEGAFWGKTQPETEDEYIIAYHGFGSGVGHGLTTGDEDTLVTGMTAEGRRVAWYEFSGENPDELVGAPYMLRTAGPAEGDVRTVAEIPRRDTDTATMTDERIAWRHGTTVFAAPVDGSAPPEPLARQATAVGSDSDEIVVATLGQDTDGPPTTTFTSYGDDGSVTTLLTVTYSGEEPVSIVDITDDLLAFGSRDSGGDITVIPLVDGIADPGENRTVVVRLGNGGVEGLSATGDVVAWVSGSVAYLLRDTVPGRLGGPDLVRIAQGDKQERMMVRVAGDWIAWSTAEGTDATINVGTLLERGELGTVHTDPAEPGSQAGAVPAAPTVTVPEDAVFRTDD